MGYLFAICALLCGAAKGFCGKKTSALVTTSRDALSFNLVRMLLCAFIGFLFVCAKQGVPTALPNGAFLWTAIFGGVSNALFVASWLLAVRRNAYMMVDVALMGGCLIPTVGCALLFDEPIRPTKMIGLLMLVAAVLLMAKYNNALKGRPTVAGVLLMIAAGVSEGCFSLSQQVYKHRVQDPALDPALFNFYVYCFSTVVLFGLFLGFLLYAKHRAPSASAPAAEQSAPTSPAASDSWLRATPYIVIMAVALFANTYFQTLATTVGALPSQVLYPFMKGAGLILSTAMSAWFFREPVSKWSIFGTGIGFVALLFINVL